MPRHNYTCNKCGAQFESDVRERVGCPECGSRRTEILWVSSGSPHRQLHEPIVLHKYVDGGFGVPGHARARTPKGAERIECRTIGEYRAAMKEMNAFERTKAGQRDEKLAKVREAMLSGGRQELTRLLARESDPLARDLLRGALERQDGGSARSFGEYFCEAMEYDSSNREAWHKPGETGMRGRK